MEPFLNWLIGKRTIIAAVATAIWTALFQQGVIDSKMFQGGVVAGGCLTAIFLRLAIQNQKTITIPFSQVTGDVTIKPGVSTLGDITVLHDPTMTPTYDNLIQGDKE